MGVSTTAWRIAAPVLVFLFNTGLTVSGWVSTTVALICWGLMLPVIVAARFWPQIQARIEGWGILAPLSAKQPTPEERWREQDALDAYFAEMRKWLGDSDAPLDQLPHDHPARKAAQEDTTRILSRLSPDGKREVVSFIHGRGLIKVGTVIISLARADLSRANLSDLGLTDAAMLYANLRDADLSDAILSNLQATEADIKKAAKRRDANWSEVNLLEVEPSQPTDVSHLIHADLSGAVLRGTHLADCILQFADFAGADLDEADLRAADLRGARNLTQEQIESAYGSRNQQGVCQITLLPDGLKAPLKWKLPLSQQKVVRQSKS